jgi:hypothetical protein
VAATPKREAWLKHINEDLGGWSGILERRASGETWRTIAKDVGCSNQFIYTMLKSAAKRSAEFAEALQLANESFAEQLSEESLDIIDRVPLDRDAIQKASQRVAHRRWLAGVYDRQRFGEPKEKPANAPLSIGELHIQALIIQRPARVAVPAHVTSGPSLPAASEPAAPVSEE